MPCKIRIFTSSAVECRSGAAFRAAISAEIAMSPASATLAPGRNFFADLAGFEFVTSERTGDAGNDSTSVALSCVRNRRFNARTAALVVTSTLTPPLSPAARRARNTKRSRASLLNPATLLCRMIRFRSVTKILSSLSAHNKKWEDSTAALPVSLPVYPFASSELAPSAPAAAVPFSDTGSARFPSGSRSICCSATRAECSS